MPPLPSTSLGHVLQTGTYSSWNKGDAAMQLTMLTALHDRGVDVTISAPFPKHDSSLYPCVVVKSRRRNLPASAVLIASSWLWRRTGRTRDWLLGDDEGRRMRDCDLVVDLSGDMLTEDSGPHVALSHFAPLLRARAMGRPYAVVAQSIGPFRVTRALARYVLGQAALVTVRERESADYLSRTMPAVRASRTADLAFLLPPAPAVPEWVPVERPLVAVSLSGIVLRAMLSNSGLDLLDEMADALDALADRHGTTSVLVSHVTGPGADKDDRRLAWQLAGRLSSPCVVPDADLDPQQVKAVIGRSSLVVGARMHANIAALSQGIPTVALAYSHKATGIMSEVGLASSVLDCRQPLDAGALRRMVLHAWETRDEAAGILRERLPAVRDRAQKNVDLVVDLLRKTAPRMAAV